MYGSKKLGASLFDGLIFLPAFLHTIEPTPSNFWVTVSIGRPLNHVIEETKNLTKKGAYIISLYKKIIFKLKSGLKGIRTGDGAFASVMT